MKSGKAGEGGAAVSPTHVGGLPDGVASRVEAEGFAVVDGLLGHEAVAEARDLVEAIFAAEADIAEDRGWRTDTYRVAYALPLKHARFVDLCSAPGVLALVRSVLGEDVRVAGCNGFDLVAGGTGQDLHRDHPHPAASTSYLHVVCALDPFTADNGSTRFVPGSHRDDPGSGRVAAGPDRARDPAAGSGSDPGRPVVTVEVPEGGAVAFDGAVLHGAGANPSGGPRRALHLFYCRSWARPHWDFAADLSQAQSSALTEEQRRLFGLDDRIRRYDHATRQVLR